MYPPMSQLTKVRITAGAAANRAERRASGCTMTRNVNGHTVAKKQCLPSHFSGCSGLREKGSGRALPSQVFKEETVFLHCLARLQL